MTTIRLAPRPTMTAAEEQRWRDAISGTDHSDEPVRGLTDPAQLARVKRSRLRHAAGLVNRSVAVAPALWDAAIRATGVADSDKLAALAFEALLREHGVDVAFETRAYQITRSFDDLTAAQRRALLQRLGEAAS